MTMRYQPAVAGEHGASEEELAAELRTLSWDSTDRDRRGFGQLVRTALEAAGAQRPIDVKGGDLACPEGPLHLNRLTACALY
jgi:hypothetical protein